MIVTITPTGDRLSQFEICYSLMMNQTIKPDKWFIIDDGACKLQNIVEGKIGNTEIVMIRHEPDPNKITLKRNLMSVLDRLNIDDKIIIIEDDDYYPNTYIETMSRLLDEYTVVGGLTRKYYNLNFKSYWEFKRLLYGTLHSTAFKATTQTLGFIREVCSNEIGYKVDIEFWRMVKKEGVSNFLHSDSRVQVIGVKGWPAGRKGANSDSHVRRKSKYIRDKNLDKLNCYFGSFSQKYEAFLSNEGSDTDWLSSLKHFFGFFDRLKQNPPPESVAWRHE
jgi:hypothetical protein